MAPQAPELLSFMDEERDIAAASATHANDASFARPAASEPDVESSSRTAVPEPQAEPEPIANGFIGFAPPPIRQFERSSTAQAATVAEASPMAAPVAETPAAEQAPLFDTPSPRSAFDIPEVTRTARLRDDEPFHAEVSNGARLNDDDTNDLLQNHTPGPLRNRSMIYFSIGLLGVALFAAALFSMFSGKASPVNLVIGLMGILLMTPAGGFFLLRFLNKRDDIAAF